MPSQVVVLFDTQYLPVTDTEMFASPEEGEGTMVDKLVAVNQDTVNRTVTVRIVPPDETPTGTEFAITINKVLSPGVPYLFPEIVGNLITAGGALRMEASAANVVLARGNGRNWTL